MDKQTKINICIDCKHQKEAPEGLCLVKKASDGLDIRCVGGWAKHKYFYIGRYIDIFSTSMRKKWELYYIDLFSGCGKCRIRETGEEINGSALMALNVKYPFKKYFFVDLNPIALEALNNRIKKTKFVDRIKLLEGDCNDRIDEIMQEIPRKDSLCLCFIDPTGLQPSFPTVERLTKDRRIDLIITFPEGMAMKRNIEKFLKEEDSILDKYMGDNSWREMYEGKKLTNSFITTSERRLVEFYKRRLESIGYKEVKSAEEVRIRSLSKRVPLYYLLFASKHPLGNKFWKSIAEIEPTGQLRLKLNNPSTLTDKSILVKTPKLKIHKKSYKMLGGKKRILVARVNDGSIIKRFDKTPYPVKLTDVVCPHFLELKWAYGCPFDCSWCYLKGTFRFRPEGIKPAFKPVEKVKLHTEAFLNQVDTPKILNTGEIADSLMKEGKNLPFSKFIIPMFEGQNKHKVLFVTKSTNIKNLLDIPSKKQVIMSFSLNAETVATKWERRAPSVNRRLEAARKLEEAGYEVRIRIDPIVPIENWQEHYLHLLNEIFSSFKPTRITLGSLRGLQSTINGTKDRSWVHFLKESSNWGKKIDFTTRLKIYKIMLEYLRNNLHYTDVALCKETVAMWEKLGMDWHEIRCNCIW